MKVTWAVIFSLGYFAVISALPAGRDGIDEVEFIPLESQNGPGPVIVDTGVIGGAPWFNSPFDGLFESFAGMMARMRQQMDYILNRLPSTNGTAENSPFPGFPDIDLSKGNTTSVTKVIDGHKVVINETEYKHDGENGGSFFKVRIIDVLPNSSEEGTEKDAESITTPLPKEPESVEGSIENEIPKNTEIEELDGIETLEQPENPPNNGNFGSNNIETFESMEGSSMKSALPHQPFQKITAGNTNWASLEPFESIEDNSVEFPYRPFDLSRDTYVNQIMADAGAPTNPDAEVFSNGEFNVPYATQPKLPFEKFMNPR